MMRINYFSLILSIGLSGCAVVPSTVVHESVKGLPKEQVSILKAATTNPIGYAYFAKIWDITTTDREMTHSNFFNANIGEVVLPPGNYEVVMVCGHEIYPVKYAAYPRANINTLAAQVYSFTCEPGNQPNTTRIRLNVSPVMKQ